MKITRIYLKNLNSLRGEFTIDLAQEPFANAGIFAITGATGAGKSTILDAITLALYGRAARYGNERPENMMSRGTGECQAEVEFEVAKGRYRATWHLKRARNKADGKLQPVQRFLYDDKGMPLAQKIGEVDQLIEELTGLDADRFFRSVLLAQGDFVKFLKATPDERATLLESLTGTSIYSLISIKAHEECVKKVHALRLRENDLENTKLLTTEQSKELLDKISNFKVSIESNTAELAKLIELNNRGQQLIKGLENQHLLKEQLTAIHREYTALEPTFKRLRLFREGSIFFPRLQSLDHLFKVQSEKNTEVIFAEKAVSTAKRELYIGINTASKMISQQLAQAEKLIEDSSVLKAQHAEKLNQLQAWLKTHQQDQTLDADLTQIVAQLTSLMHERHQEKEMITQHAHCVKEIVGIQQHVHVFHQQQNEESKILQAKKESLENIHANYLNLLQGHTKTHFSERIGQLQSYASLLQKKQAALKEWRQIDQERKEMAEKIQLITVEHAEACLKTELEEKAIFSEQNEIKLLKEQQQAQRAIANFQQERTHLQPGHSCPLCGSLAHPFLEDLEEPLSKINELEQTLKICEENRTKREREFKKHILANAKREENLRHSTEIEIKLSAKAEEQSSLLQSIDQKLQRPYQNNCTTDLEIENELHSIQKELADCDAIVKQVEENMSIKNELQKSIVNAEHALELSKNKIKVEENKCKDLQVKAEVNQTSINHIQSEIVELERSMLMLLQPYKIEHVPIGEEKILLKLLDERKRSYQDNFHLTLKLQHELQTLFSQTLDQKKECEKLQSQQQQLNDFLKLYVGTHEEISDLKHLPVVKCQSIAEAWEVVHRLEKALSKAQHALEEQQKELAKVLDSYRELESSLSEELVDTAFSSIVGLRAVQLSNSETLEIQKNEDLMRGRLENCQGQLSQIESQLNHLLTLGTPQGEDFQLTQRQYLEMNKQTIQQRESLAVFENDRRRDEQNRLRYAAILKELELERQRLMIWQKLSHLIGSHNGQNFRKFAQGLSLDLLIKHANKHLLSLNDRYRLKRMLGEELDLEIQDLHQANATRPIASLSGGESFLTSLALALGLSDLAGKNVRIDSLFIDEGFGSLDAETLEIAVQALESLRSNHKTIGVISHIELLKERIPTQIVIEKKAGGVSTMSFENGA